MKISSIPLNSTTFYVYSKNMDILLYYESFDFNFSCDYNKYFLSILYHWQSSFSAPSYGIFGQKHKKTI